MENRIYAIYLTAVCIIFVNCQVMQDKHGSYSPKLQGLLVSALAECSIGVYLDATDLVSVTEFETLVSFYAINGFEHHAFYIEDIAKNRTLIPLPDPERMNGTGYWTYVSTDNPASVELRPNWILAKHMRCYSQLYFFHTTETLKNILALFVRWVMVKKNPNFIVLWDTKFNSETDFSVYFQRPEFQGSLTDYRFYISREIEDGEYTAYIICLYCNSFITPFNTTVITDSFLLKMHRELYQKANETVIAYNCFENSRWCKRKDLLVTVAQGLNTTYNMLDTTDFSGNKLIPAVITDAYPLNPTNVELLFLSILWPSFHISPSTPINDPLVMMTVFSKPDLEHNGLKSLFISLPADTWIGFTVALVVVLFVLGTLQKEKGCVWLSVFAPMIDHWMNATANPFSCRVIVLWSFLCWSLTLLYGGEIATSLTALNSPYYPLTLDEVASNVITLDGLRRFEVWFSYTADHIKLLANEIKLSPQTNYSRNYKTRILKLNATVAKTLQKNYCRDFNAIFTRLPSEYPFACMSANISINWNSPITFVGFEEQINDVQAAFSTNKNYWVSPKSMLPLFLMPRYVITMRNYFAKLADPIISSWWTFGLEEHRVRLNSNVKLKDIDEETHSFTSSATGGAIVNEHNPENLASIGSIFPLFYILFGFSIFIFCLESCPHALSEIRYKWNILSQWFQNQDCHKKHRAKLSRVFSYSRRKRRKL